VSAATETWEQLLTALEQLPPASLDHLVAAYRDLRDQQHRRLPLLPEPADADAEQALNEQLIRGADEYTDRAESIIKKLKHLTPTPTTVPCPEFGL